MALQLLACICMAMQALHRHSWIAAQETGKYGNSLELAKAAARLARLGFLTLGFHLACDGGKLLIILKKCTHHCE